MQATSETVALAETTPNTMRWAGRIASALPVLFLVFDGAMKVVNIQPVVDASMLLGMPVGLAPGVGILLLACVAVYLAPRTAVLGAILLTGYLGGAMALQLRIGAPLFSIILPFVLGVLLWGGLYLRDSRLRVLIPMRR